MISPAQASDLPRKLLALVGAELFLSLNREGDGGSCMIPFVFKS